MYVTVTSAVRKPKRRAALPQRTIWSATMPIRTWMRRPVVRAIRKGVICRVRAPDGIWLPTIEAPARRRVASIQGNPATVRRTG
jgi:hypothetical protein